MLVPKERSRISKCRRDQEASIQVLRKEANLLWAMQLLMIVPRTDLFKKIALMEAGMILKGVVLDGS